MGLTGPEHQSEGDVRVNVPSALPMPVAVAVDMPPPPVHPSVLVRPEDIKPDRFTHTPNRELNLIVYIWFLFKSAVESECGRGKSVPPQSDRNLILHWVLCRLYAWSQSISQKRSLALESAFVFFVGLYGAASSLCPQLANSAALSTLLPLFLVSKLCSTKSELAASKLVNSIRAIAPSFPNPFVLLVYLLDADWATLRPFSMEIVCERPLLYLLLAAATPNNSSLWVDIITYISHPQCKPYIIIDLHAVTAIRRRGAVPCWMISAPREMTSRLCDVCKSPLGPILFVMLVRRAESIGHVVIMTNLATSASKMKRGETYVSQEINFIFSLIEDTNTQWTEHDRARLMQLLVVPGNMDLFVKDAVSFAANNGFTFPIQPRIPSAASVRVLMSSDDEDNFYKSQLDWNRPRDT
jgi:hypothetical protein